MSETAFTETVRTKLTVVKDKCAVSAGVGFPPWECTVENKEDYEGDANR